MSKYFSMEIPQKDGISPKRKIYNHFLCAFINKGIKVSEAEEFAQTIVDDAYELGELFGTDAFDMHLELVAIAFDVNMYPLMVDIQKNGCVQLN